MNHQLGELEALAWLRDAAAAEPAIPAEAQARLLARLSRDVGAAALGQLGAVTSLSEPTALSTGTAQRVLVSRLAVWSAPALVIGASLGVVGHAALVKEKTRVVYVDRFVSAPPLSTVPSAESLALEPENTVAEPARAANIVATVEPKAAAVAVTRGEGALARERAVLDPARADLASGEPARALTRVQRHSKEFPNGILSEEREAIAINALVSLGSYPQATKRAAAFRARYPQSLMTYSVDAAMAAVPKD